jgi:hypothetical protein
MAKIPIFSLAIFLLIENALDGKIIQILLLLLANIMRGEGKRTVEHTLWCP